MVSVETVCGHEVNVTRSKEGTPRSACVLVGEPDRAGMRAKDAGAKAQRKAIRQQVADALGLPIADVRAVARFSRLRDRGDGTADVLNDLGETVGNVKL